MTLLAVTSLAASLGQRRVLENISLNVAPGEFIGLIGPNGAGKSTLLRALMGLTPSTGTVRLSGSDSATLPPSQRALKAAYVAQDRDIAWAMPVEAIVALGRSPHVQHFAPLQPEDQTHIEQAMQRMDIQPLRHRPATQLSGGERARVLIARALAQDTPLLLADEPTSGLDPAHQIALMQLFSELAAQGRSVIASTHDLGLAARWCTRLLLLDAGQLVADGSPEAVLTPQRLRSVYGVEAYFGETGGRPMIHPTDLASKTT